MMEEIFEFEINKALTYLKDGYVISSINNKKRTYFMMKKEEITLLNANFKSSIKIDQFLELYKECVFSLVQDEEESVDLKRDEEYYSWRNK